MAYYLTPAERKAIAKAKVQNRKDVVAYNKYLQQKKDYENQIAQAKLDEENRQKQIDSQDFFTRAISTVGDISANIITGALKGLEGIYDLGAGIVGAVGGIFSEDFQNSVKSHIATDWVGKYIGDPLQELTKYSYTKNGGIIEGVASGIGQMLPAVAVTIATGGAGAPAAVAELASLVTLGASAAGNATEEAFNDGASYYAGLGYGLASGAVEMATEKMFGGFGKLAGAGYLDNVTRSIAKQGVARIAKEAVEEGLEEVVAELANPALKSIYKGSEAFQEYGDPEYWKGVGQAGLIGGLTSMAYGQTVGRVMHTSGKYADVSEALAEVDSLAKKAQNLTETGKLYEKSKSGKINSDVIHDSMVENLRLIENTVKKVDESKRAKFIKQAGLTDIINTDGTIKSEYAMSRGLSSMVAQQSTEGQETAQSPLASQPKQYRTAFADERVIKEALDRGGATAFVGEMTAEQARDFGDFSKVFGKLANKSNGFLKFVVGENVAGNSYIDTQTGVIVMGIDQFGKGTSGVDLANAVITSDMWQKSAIHEVKHSTEGTKQDSRLNAHLYEDNAVFEEARDSFIRRGYLEERVGKNTQKAGEYLDSLLVKVDEVMRNKPKNVSMEEHIKANLTTEELQDYRTAQSEIGAIAAENVLGNESFIKKLLRKDTNIAQKILNRVMDMKEAFASLKSKEARAAYNYLQKAEKLYLKAIEEVGAKFQKRRIIGIRRLEDGEAVDATPQMQYNEGEAQPQYSKKDSLINKTFPTYQEGKGTQANELSTRWAHRADIQVGDQTAISFNDSWYLIEKFDDSELGYQIVDKLTEQEYLTYEEEWKNGNREGQSIQEGVSRFTSLDRQRNSSNRGKSNNDSSRPQQRGENQKVRGVGEEQAQRGQAQSSGSGDSKSSRSSKQRIKHSLQDGEVSESALSSLEQELNVARQAEKEAQSKLESIEGFNEQKEKLHKILGDKSSTNETIDVAIKEYAQWEKESGYGAAYKEYQEASRRANELRRESERMRESLAKKLLEKQYTTEEIGGFVQKAVRKFHTTPYLNRASYLLTTGSMLDFSDGQGYRVQDHREISEVLNLPDYADYSTGMIVFMNMGNIRLQSYGIDIAAMPNEKQISSLRGIISKVMGEYDEFVVDFSKPNGDTDGSITYPQGTSSARIISDIKKYFETGVLPEEPSSLSRFRYSLKPVEPIRPSSDEWHTTLDTDKALARFPNLWNVKAEESEVRNPTQIKGTVSTYRKIYEVLKKEGFDGKILDASSGLGYGTRAGIDEYGFKVEDIEPYPDSKYKPKYTDYSTLDEHYDVIISNAVLNVLPQDQRDALVVKMGELLNLGGRLFVNVRGDDVNNLSSNPNNVRIGEMEWYVAPTGSYQKGFTRAELVAYLKDALGKNFKVEPTTLFGKSSAIVTKNASENLRYSLKDSEGKVLSEGQRKYFEESKVRDNEGNLLVVYHGTMSGDFTVFDASYSNVESDMGAGFYFSSSYEDVNANYEEGGQDLEAKIERLAEKIEYDEEIDYDEAKEKARKQLSKSSKLFEVYLDMKNPVYVGGNFDETTYLFQDYYESELEMEDFDSEDDYYEAQYEEQEEALSEIIDRVDRILSNEGIGGYEDWVNILSENGAFEGITIADLKDLLANNLEAYDDKGNLANNEVVRAIVEALGYDGIIDNSVVDKWGYNSGRMNFMEGLDEETRHYIVFKPEQIKLTTNENPTTNEDIRFSRKVVDETKKTYYHLSDGQIKKMLANSTRYKVYSKVDAEGIINNVLQNYMSFGEKYGDMSGKTKAQVIDMLWKGLNSAKPGYQMGVALNIADYIIQNSVLETLYGDMENYEVQQALDIIGALKPYLHRVNLDSIKGEIKHKYDKDNSAYLLWGKRKGESGLGADQIAQELQAKGIQIEAINVADIFFEIDSQYRNAVKSLKKKAKDMLAEALPKEQQKALRQDIAKEILRGFDYTGKSSQLAGVLDKYRKQISDLYDKLRDSNRHNRATNRLLDKVQKIKNWKTGAFVNSSKYRPKLFKGSIERLAMIKNRGNLNQSGTRRILAGLAEWYAKDNPILGYVDGDNVGIYNQEIADILQAVAQNQKALTDEQVDLISVLQEKSGITDYKGLLEWYTKANLGKGYSAEVKSLLRELASETTFTTEEIIALEKVVGYFGNLIENYNKVIRNGKYVDAKPIAEGYIETIKRNKGVKVGWFSKFFDKVFNNGKASYLQTFADPMTVARYMDKYENGFYSEMLAELRAGGIKASVLEMNIRQPLEEFLSKHKKYGRGVSQRTIKYKGAELPALDAFLLYMTMNREQALGGLAEAGFTFNNGKETIRVDGFAKGEELTLAELRERAKAEQDELYKQFTEEDREYISIAEKIFNEDCKETKRETDILRQGYSNVFEGYYVPIRRANGAVTVDTGTFFDEMNRVSNASFNKDTVQGAKGELFIGGLDEVLDKHIHGVSQYASLATVIDQYNILYNLNMVEDANKPITVRTESENTWAKGGAYFDKLISDVQGISPTRGGGSKLFGFLRGGYAKYQLGLNPKVWLTQLSSLFASSSILDYSSIVKGFGIKAPDVDDYCSLAAVRNNDNSAAMAQSVLDKVDKFGSALMKPIGMVDRFVIKRLFGACQAQVQKESGLKIGTKENKVKAGELLQKVIVETQQNSMATERSAAMRSGSELMKTLTMFTADSMKVFGRVMDSIGEVSVLKHKIKETSDPKVKESLQAQLKTANKKARKSITALAASAIFMALVAQAFRWLYNKDDDDDESVLATMTVDAIGNLMGGLPLIKDIYAKLTDGYELNNYAYSAINDLFDAFTSIVNFSEGKPAKKVKDIVYAVGQIFGIPTRNIYNIFYGLTKRFSPTTAYEIDTAFYNKNYSADLQKAIDNDDEDMIATITGLMLDEKVGKIESITLQRELNSLVSKGYKVLPRSIGNSITYNGEEIALTSRQKEQFKNVYSEANSELASLVEGKAYRSATEEVKAKAVSFIWDIYYNLAIEDLLGVDLETKNTLFAKAIDIPSLAIIVATARGLEGDTDKNGKVISGSKKAKVQGYINSLGLTAAQKYMIMGYLGYSNKNGESKVRSYIQRLRLSKSEKEKLFEYSGYAA